MRSIAIMNQKGGVGKTTTTVNLAAALARSGQRICLVDLDPQAHASLHLGLDPLGDVRTMYDVLTADVALSDVCQKVDENLWVAGSTIDLAAADVQLAAVEGRERVLRNKLLGSRPPCDFLLIDCPPSLGLLTLNALAAVDEVILPLQPHFLALHGLSKLLETTELVAERLNPRLRLSGVLFCMYESSTRLASEVADEVEAFFRVDHGRTAAVGNVRIYETRIRRNIRLAEAPSFGQSIFAYAPHSNGAADYEAFAHELLHAARQRIDKELAA